MLTAPLHSDQHILHPSGEGEGYLDVYSAATPTPAGQCLRPEAEPAGPADDQNDLGDRRVNRPPLRNLQDEDPLTVMQETPGNELAQRIASLPVTAEDATVENRRCQVEDTLQTTTLVVFGCARHQHHDWFDDNDTAISKILAAKNRLHNAYANCYTGHNKTVFHRSHRLVQQRLREMQDAWKARKAMVIQGYAHCNERKNFFAAIKTVYGPTANGTAPLLSTHGTALFTEKEQILKRWAWRFRNILNRPSAISDAAIARLSQVETNADVELRLSLHETTRTVQQLSSGKASESDTISAEIFKPGDPQLTNHLTALFQEM
ncbi:hypothetical protein SprV_0401514800 [Sparganum proliferum]